MALGLIESQYLQDIADAIRNKTGDTTEFKPHELATAIRADLVYPTGTKYIAASDIKPNVDSQYIDVTNYAKVGIPTSSVGLLSGNIKKYASIFGLAGTTPCIVNNVSTCEVRVANTLEFYSSSEPGGIYIDYTKADLNSGITADWLQSSMGDWSPSYVTDIDGNRITSVGPFNCRSYKTITVPVNSIIAIASTHNEMSSPYTSGGPNVISDNGWLQLFLVKGRGTIVIID